jgi:FkbM family methyltransferase
MSYRILIVNTDYGHFLDQLYGRNPALSASSFEVQQKARFDAFFGVNDFYSSNLRKLGHWAIDIIYNNKFSQYTWAVENGFAKRGLTQQEITALPDNWLAAVFVAQVKTYKPDVIVNLAMESVTSEILNRVRSAVKLIVGQHAAPITNSMCNLSEYDLFVSSIPAYVELFKSKGIKSEYFKLGFEGTILQKINQPAERDIDIAFVGGFMPHHSSGTDLFDYLAKEGFKLALFGYGQDYLSPEARQFYCGSVFGRDMYEIYSRAKIVLNRHINISGEYANNLRLYEATGCGALLLTDTKKNLNELFAVGREIDAYSSNHHCAELLRYYLDNQVKSAAIAKAGQQRTLTEHSYYNRMAELGDIIGNYIGQRSEINSDKCRNENNPDCTELTVSDNSAMQDLKNLKAIALKKRFGNWKIKFSELTIYCCDLLSFYYASKDIFYHRIYDFESNSDAPVVIDGGGHIGLFTLYVKCKYPKAKITVFEPEQQSLELLRKNLAANCINDVKIVEAGLYKENTKLSFGSDNSDGSSIFAKEKDLSINVVKLSDYIKSPVDFVKLNIEGAELDVISEMSSLLYNVKELVFEYHGFPEIGQNLHKILPILADAGFRYMIHDFDAETNSASKPPFKLREDTRYFLLVYAKKLFTAAKINSSQQRPSVSTNPVSRVFGLDRGRAIDRFYIEQLLEQNSRLITGNVLEIGGNEYTKKFGRNVTKSDVLNAVPSEYATIIGDLTDADCLPENYFDCIILTQTLQFIYDFKTAVQNAIKALKTNGTLLLTTSGISQISRYDMDRWGEYWRFTDRALQKMFAEFMPAESFEVRASGNVAIAKAFLDGYAIEDIDKQLFEYDDNDYQVVLTVRATRPALTANKINFSGKQNKPVILLYHRVADEPMDYQLLCTSPKNFETHLKILSENYRVVRLAELLDEIRNNRLVPNTVALTFDDGYVDNFSNALPLLEKYKIPATIFVASGMVGLSGPAWWDAMGNIFLCSENLPKILKMEDNCGSIEWDLSTPQKRIEAHDEICGVFRHKPAQETYPIVEQLLRWAGLNGKTTGSRRIVNEQELLRLSQSEFIYIGSHTVWHSQLTSLTPQQQDFELGQSARHLQEIIHKPVEIVSYPFGGADDFDVTTKQIAKKYYAAGIANVQSELAGNIDMFAVPRRLVRNWSSGQFEGWLKSDDRRILEAQTIAARKDDAIKYISKLSANSAAIR